jgi:protein subunit release factor B
MKIQRAFISAGFCWPIPISIIRPSTCIVDGQRSSSSSYAKKQLKYYKFADILVDECSQQNVRGSGPGGSCVNAAGNCVVLKHKSTNCFVKVCNKMALRN